MCITQMLYVCKCEIFRFQFYEFTATNLQMQMPYLSMLKCSETLLQNQRDCKKIDATTPMFPWMIVAKKIY